MRKIIAAAIGAALFGFTSAYAVPVTAEGTLSDGVTAFGAVSPDGDFDDPDSALSDYWYFSGNFGDTVTVTVNRLEEAFDPSFWVFAGMITDTDFFNGVIDGSDPGFIDFGDDEIPNPGPFGDPFAEFELTLPMTGIYTIIVTNFLSGTDDGDGLFPYSIVATNIDSTSEIPIPAAALIFPLGIAGLQIVRKRRKAKA